MRHSTHRILVSHAGNLPRPRYLDELIEGGKNRDGSHTGEYHQRLPRGVKEIVNRQVELGVDIVNDGEYAKAGSYGGYMQERVDGFIVCSPRLPAHDIAELCGDTPLVLVNRTSDEANSVVPDSADGLRQASEAYYGVLISRHLPTAAESPAQCRHGE